MKNDPCTYCTYYGLFNGFCDCEYDPEDPTESWAEIWAWIGFAILIAVIAVVAAVSITGYAISRYFPWSL